MSNRGSALVSVILVLLVLTIVGVGIAYFTSMEDRLSGNTRIAKAGFYAADAGLRRGEAMLNKAVNVPPTTCNPPSITTLLVNRLGPDVAVPGGGYPAQILDLTNISTSAAGCLLAAERKPYQNIAIPVPAGTPVVDSATYTLYLRNNTDDTTGDATTDGGDNLVNLISIGTVRLAGGTTLTKIVEEQLLLSTGGQTVGSQKSLYASGTNAIVSGGS